VKESTIRNGDEKSNFMKSIIRFNKIPSNSIIADGLGDIGYCDSYRITKSTEESVGLKVIAISLPQNIILLKVVRNEKIFDQINGGLSSGE
jgi:hypothetical protein